MVRGLLVVMLAVAVISVPSLFASEKLYQAGQILSIQQKSQSRVLYYVVNTPITEEEPYYEVSVQLDKTVYLGRYFPRHSDEALPGEWAVGAPVQARVDGHHLFLKRPNGVGVEFAIAKRTAVKAEPTNSEPTPAKK
jgi:hypothetical protein